MKSLLYPAVALMNRLSFGMKFSLINVLFLLPMLATNYYLVRDSWREFQGTRIELQSLDLLGSSLALRRDLETLNNQVQINATLGQSGKAGDLEGKISALEQSVLNRLQSLSAMTTEPEQIAAFDAKRDELRKPWPREYAPIARPSPRVWVTCGVTLVISSLSWRRSL